VVYIYDVCCESPVTTFVKCVFAVCEVCICSRVVLLCICASAGAAPGRAGRPQAAKQALCWTLYTQAKHFSNCALT
jgi:hypothetical protein